MTDSATYDTDFHAWATENARWLREGRLDQVDVAHLAEELEGMSASERRELLDRLQVLLLHLLKYQYQPERRGNAWQLTINHQRTALERLFEQSPSLARFIDDERLSQVYRKARRDAIIETDLDAHLLPETCPYSLAQCLDDDWLPTP